MNFDLTHSQYDIWNSQNNHPTSPLYNENIAVEIIGELDQNRFAECWDHIVVCTPSLRTQVVTVDGKVKQNHDAEPPKLSVVDFSNSDNAKKDADQWMLAKANLAQQIDKGTVNTAILKLGHKHWIWFIQQHHIAVDAGSMALIWNQLVKLYQVENLQTVEKDNYSYQHFLQSYTEKLTALSDSVEKDHWISRANAKTISLYGASPDASTTKCTRLDFELDSENIETFNSLLSQSPYRTFNKDLGFYQILLTALIGWLHTISLENSIAVNIPSACRTNEDEKNCIGYFIELLPFKVDIPEKCNFESLYKIVQQESMRFIRFSKTGACQFKQSETSNIFFNYIKADFDSFPGFKTKVNWISTDEIDANHALRIHIVNWQSDAPIQIAIDFNNAWFNEKQRSLAVEHAKRALRLYTKSPDQKICALPLVGNQDIWKVEDDTPNQKSIQSGARLHKNILAVCENQPNDISVVQGEISLTYAQLAHLSNKVAYFLGSNGVNAGDRVVLHLERRWELLPALIGCLKAGAVYVPIDTCNPKQKIRAIENSAQPAIIISAESHFSQFNAYEKCVTIEQILQVDDSHGFDQNVSYEKVVSNDNAPAYILYTSGSTGEPKGVEVSHGSLWHFCNWTKNRFHKNEPLVFPLISSIGFDITAIPLYIGFLTGGSLHVYPNNNLSDATSVLEMITNNQINTVIATPSQFSLIKDMNLSHTNISQIVLLGEDFKTSLAQDLNDAFSGQATIYNGYGPTESTIACFLQQYDHTIHTKTSVPIGSPLAGMEGYILNQQQKPQAQGVAGELYLTGPLLANGYWQDRTRTEAVFIEIDEFPNKIFYKTGDMVRVNEKGLLEYLGRNDNQIKRNGIRIELGEIEGAALNHPNVRSAAAKLFSGKNGDASVGETGELTQNQLVLYLVSTVEIDNRDMLGYLSLHLSDAFLPDRVVCVESFPLNVNGKTDYKKLEQPLPEKRSAVASSRKPESEIEHLWVSIWENYIAKPHIDLSDNFFKIGGNSLLAIQITSDINKHGYQYEPTDIFKYKTIALLSTLSRELNSPEQPQKIVNTPFSSISKKDLATIQQLIK